ncbi:MAG: glycerophosphodiester phosphodiesterase [Alphaproteobacteria bacterium]
MHPYLEDGFLAFAHRGGALEMPENTLAAFRRAAELGYRYLELDVRATRDGRVAVFHDAELDRVTDAEGLVSHCRWDELKSVRVAGREPIPLLEEVLDAFPESKINIDAKDDAVVEPLTTLLRRADALARVCVGCFSAKRLARLRRLLGTDACTALGPGEVTRLWLAARLGIPPGSFTGRCAQVPVTHYGMEVVTPRFVKTCARAELPVHVWTIDDPVEMNRLIDMGVSGLMTDRPEVLKGELQRRALWRGG